jgi:plastocyanin
VRPAGSRLALALAAALLCAPSADPGTVEVRGRVALAFDAVALASLGPIAVYLEPLDRPVEAAREHQRIRQRDATFQPGFSIATAGTEIELLNDDSIFHNVFSFSGPNAFDLGLYPRGESRSVRLMHPGEVHLYCSIHESMSATVLVVPTPHHALCAPDGSFRMDGVPPGRYRLRTWNANLPALSRPIEVGPRSEPLELLLGKPE